MSSTRTQSLPVVMREEQATAAKTKIELSKTAITVIAITVMTAIVIPSAVLGKLYKDEKDKNDYNPSILSIERSVQAKDPHALTVWWAIFNKPENCIQDPGAAIKCGMLDVFGSAFLESRQANAPNPSLIETNAEAEIAMLYATGGVTDDNGDIRMQASIIKSSDTNLKLSRSLDPLRRGVALTNPEEAEVHFVIRDHGVSVGDVTQTLFDSDAYCDDPPSLWSGKKQDTTGNICKDFQFAAFASGESGIQNLTFYANGEQSKQSEVHLYLRGDGYQTIIKTNVFE